MEIRVVRDVLEKNRRVAWKVRERCRRDRHSLLNLMSAPGSGKTSLLEKLIPLLVARGLRPAVIEGDVETTNDSERLAPLGIPVAHVCTGRLGGACHIPANVILAALDEFRPGEADCVIIENVGNLVCPAEVDTGADADLVMVSVTEGEDKPLKYPMAFRRAALALVSKADLAAAAGCDLGLLEANIRAVNPDLPVLRVSVRDGSGLEDLAGRVEALHRRALGA